MNNKNVVIVILILFALLLAGCAQQAVQQIEADSEQDLRICVEDADCIIVPYSHCCGSSKKAINRKYLDSYLSHPEWQKFDGPDCAVMGICAPDSDKISASCDNGFCGLDS